MSDIDQLKREHEGEWLAIAYENYGVAGPTKGELIAHSSDKANVWKAIRGSRRKIYVTYSGPPIKDGTAIAL
jgi:hypothetical protein